MEKHLKYLSRVSGGSVFNAPQEIAGDKDYHYEVIDINGDVIGKFNSMKKAKDYAISIDLNAQEISWEEVLKRRNDNK